MRFPGIIKRSRAEFRAEELKQVMNLFAVELAWSFSSQELVMIELIKGQTICCNNREIHNGDNTINYSTVNKGKHMLNLDL